MTAVLEPFDVTNVIPGTIDTLDFSEVESDLHVTVVELSEDLTDPKRPKIQIVPQECGRLRLLWLQRAHFPQTKDMIF